MTSRTSPYIAFILLCLLLLGNGCFAQNNSCQSPEKHIGVAMRMIGHRILLVSGDSTSRVLPIKTLKKHQYEIEFTSKFQFDPENILLSIALC